MNKDAQFKEIVKLTYQAAVAAGVCTLFNGQERTIGEMATLMKSPQGIEFCTTHNFPSLPLLRLYGSYTPQEYGIYIDAGEIYLKDPTNVILAGNTFAKIECKATQSHRVTLLQGATADVLAGGWAVVKINAALQTEINTHASEHAKII